MPKTENTIGLDYRPESYFGPVRLEDHIPSRIKGAMRRAWVRKAIESGSNAGTLGAIAESALSTHDRITQGRIHPALMGGEYLPDLESQEIEIARIHLNSTTGDVADLRARRDGDRIQYRVVDEYDGETLSEPSERSSTQPLTLGELSEFFLAAWGLREVLEMNELSLRGALEFVNPSSEFYPQFASLVELRIHEWLSD